VPEFKIEAIEPGRCFEKMTERLVPMPKLCHWRGAGRAKGFSEIVEVGAAGVTVGTNRGTRFVPRRDFEAILRWWPDYRNGKVQRHKLRFCVNSTYVLSVFHWFEQQPISRQEDECERHD
jgi:hypothetical protein